MAAVPQAATTTTTTTTTASAAASSAAVPVAPLQLPRGAGAGEAESSNSSNSSGSGGSNSRGVSPRTVRSSATAMRAMIVTDTASETSEYGSVQVPAVLEMLQVLLRQNVPLDAVAVVDVAPDFEQRFWVVTQTLQSYPHYPQLYIADQRFGTLKGLYFALASCCNHSHQETS